MRNQLFIFILLLMTWHCASAQVKIRIDKKKSFADSGSLHGDTAVRFYCYITNVGDSSFTGNLVTHARTSKGIFIIDVLPVADFKPGDTTVLTPTLYFSRSTVSAGSDIIVIWPTGTKAKTLDSFSAPVQVKRYTNTAVNKQDTTITVVYSYSNSIEGVKIYPVPAHDKLYLDMQGQDNIKDVKLSDLSGREVLHGWTGSNSLDLSGLPDGMYLLSLQTNSGKQVIYKIVKSE